MEIVLALTLSMGSARACCLPLSLFSFQDTKERRPQQKASRDLGVPVTSCLPYILPSFVRLGTFSHFSSNSKIEFCANDMFWLWLFKKHRIAVKWAVCSEVLGISQ